MKTYLLLKRSFVLLVVTGFFMASCKRTQLVDEALVSKDKNISEMSTVYYVSNTTELNALTLQPGDKVILEDGIWNNVTLKFKGTGTEANKITFSAATPGEVHLTGQSKIEIDGTWLVIKGLKLKDGYSTHKKDVVKFSANSSHCRLTDCSIIDFNHPVGYVQYKWVTVSGVNHRIDRCEFTGKTDTGATVVVNVDSIPNYHQIDWNYFGPRPPLGANGGESLRIGVSTSSQLDSYTTVKQNIFDKCDGEAEIISIKSGRNTVRDNLFYESAGTVTFRQGNYNTVNYNYFIGNNKSNTGGVRIIGENQTVKSNYFKDLKGTNARAAISVRNAQINPELHEYWQVKNADIQTNILVNCNHNFVLGEAKNSLYTVKPDSVKIANNYVLSPNSLIIYTDTPTNLNIYNNQTDATLTTGFIAMVPNQLQWSDGILQRSSNVRTPFWLDTNIPIGPEWKTRPTFPL